MNLWPRLLLLICLSPFRPRLVPPDAVSRLGFRVWPHDLDTSLHMNNGRYWAIMDLGRADLVLRSGLWRSVLRRRWTPVLGAATIRFRRELRAFQRFRLETRILHWTGTNLVIEQRVLCPGRGRGGEVVAAIALLRAGLYDRRARAFVPIAELMRAVGIEAESPPPSPAVAAFLAGEDALKRAP